MPSTKPSNTPALGFKPLTQHKQAKSSKLGPDVEYLTTASIPEVYKTFISTGVTS